MKRLIILAALVVATAASWAKKPTQEVSYNIQRGIEAANNDRFKEAMTYFNRALNDDPENGLAFVWSAHCRYEQGNYGMALNNSTRAIRYLPKKDKENLAWAYNLRCVTQIELKDTVAALQDISQAIKLEPRNTDWWELRGRIFYRQMRYTEAMADFQQSFQILPGYAYPVVMLGNCQRHLGNHEEAIKLYSRAVLLEKDNASALAFRATSLLAIGKNLDAANDIADALSLDIHNKYAREHFSQLPTDAFQQLLSRIEAKTTAAPNDFDWQFTLACLLDEHGEYTDAIAAYKKNQTITPYSWLNYYIADCYRQIHDPKHALAYINQAVEGDSLDLEFLLKRINIKEDILDETGNDLGIEDDCRRMLDIDPEEANAYFRMGKLQFLGRNYSDALKNFATAAVFAPHWGTPLYWQAHTCLQLGDSARAEQFFRQSLAISSSANRISYAHLGDSVNAVRASDRWRKAHPDDNGYDEICMYAVLGDTARAIHLADSILRGGYVFTSWARHDPDLANIAASPRFIHLLDSADEVVRQRVLINDSIEAGLTPDSSSQPTLVEVPFTTAGGVTKVNCTVNNLPLSFVFDTGCSDVTISQVEANFMFKNGYLTAKDVSGKQHFMTADGSISVGTTIVLRHINFGGLELTDVRASVVDSQQAPLLLGQSVLQRLGKVEIDNTRKILKITSR